MTEERGGAAGTVIKVEVETFSGAAGKRVSVDTSSFLFK